MILEHIGIIVLLISILLLLSILYYFNFSNDFRIIISLFAALEGFSSLFISSKYSVIFGLILFFISINYIIKNNTLASRSVEESDNHKGLLILKKYKSLFPYIGIFFLIITILHVIFFSNLYLGDHEILVIINFSFWVFYNYIPNSYSLERNFIFLFLNLIVLLVVVPGFFYTLIYNSSFYNEDRLIELFLTKPLFNIFSLTGIHSVYEGNTISFVDSQGHIRKVWIAAQCSGIFSVQIFAAAFISFVLLELNLKDFSTSIFLFLGLFLCYIANLFRMLIIIIVGYYFGMEALAQTHAYAGWLIFTFWMAIFWSFISKNIDIPYNR